jgi:hypothetical protein
MFNDRKAPRFNQRKFRKNIVSEDLWKRWKLETGYNVSFSDFKNIWNNIAISFIQNVLEERDGVKLGAGMGEIYIGFIPSLKSKIVDPKTSEEYKKEIKYENWDTSGKVGKIIYATRGRKYIYKTAGWWAFKASRIFKQATSKSLRTHPNRYKNSIEKRK